MKSQLLLHKQPLSSHLLPSFSFSFFRICFPNRHFFHIHWKFLLFALQNQSLKNLLPLHLIDRKNRLETESSIFSLTQSILFLAVFDQWKQFYLPAVFENHAALIAVRKIVPVLLMIFPFCIQHQSLDFWGADDIPMENKRVPS